MVVHNNYEFDLLCLMRVGGIGRTFKNFANKPMMFAFLS